MKLFDNLLFFIKECQAVVTEYSSEVRACGFVFQLRFLGEMGEGKNKDNSTNGTSSVVLVSQTHCNHEKITGPCLRRAPPIDHFTHKPIERVPC